MFSSDLSRESMKHDVRLRALLASLVEALDLGRLLPKGRKSVFERFIPTKKCEDKEIREKESNPKNIPHEEVFIGCTIIGIIFDSCIA
jgi:hypothetical protein